MASMTPYLLSLLLVIALVLAGACFMAWHLFNRPRHALFWSVSFALSGFYYGMALLQGLFSSEAWFWLSSHLLAFLSVFFAAWGHRARLGLPIHKSLMLIALLLMCSVSLIINFFYPEPGLREALAPACALFVIMHVSLILLVHVQGPRLAQYVAGAIHFLFVLSQGLIVVLALNLGRALSLEAMYELYALVSYGLVPALYIAMGISIIFLLATDLAQRLNIMALQDHLTGLHNRRGYLAVTEALLKHCQQQEKSMAVVLADIDHFKQINDRYGHYVGDLALQYFTQVFRECTRERDALGRIGGEEVAVTMANMDSAGAASVVARIRQQLKEKPMHYDGGKLTISASFGVAQLQEDDSVATLINRADMAMYEAKAAGRDAVIVSEGSEQMDMDMLSKA